MCKYLIFVYICIGEWCLMVGDNGGNDCIYDVGEYIKFGVGI